MGWELKKRMRSNGQWQCEGIATDTEEDTGGKTKSRIFNDEIHRRDKKDNERILTTREHIIR